MSEYIQCKRCVMDNQSDNTIKFNDDGYCNYCEKALGEIGTDTYFPDEVGKKKLSEMTELLKMNGKNKDYDCIMGISGGLDSSYLAYLGYEWGLRILAVHIDDGYDTEISKTNIAKLCKAAKIELKTITPDPVQYNALTLAYMRAGVPNLAVPQDNILLAFLYDTVRKSGIKYFLPGGNYALECILQQDHSHNSLDTVNIRDINSKFGMEKLNKLKFCSSYRKYIYQKTGIIISFRPLNYIDYNRTRAFKELHDFCEFEYYGSKHLENILTAFIQLYWLPKKFGVDKRKSHLSSMIASGQMTREEALAELDKPLYDKELMRGYISFIEKKLGITHEQFEAIMAAPSHEHSDYRTDKAYTLLRKISK